MEFNGNSTECALLLMTRGVHDDFGYAMIRKLYADSKLKTYDFTSARKMSSVVIAFKDAARLYTKGAAEIVLGHCTRYSESQGVLDMTPEKRGEMEAVIHGYASRGLRTICLAHRDLDPSAVLPDDPPETDLILDCVVGIMDPVRPEVPDAVALCEAAGITVRMVTGDNLETACNIAKVCGIVRDGSYTIATAKCGTPYDGYQYVMEGPEFRKLEEHKRLVILPHLRVLARSSPNDKYLLVQGLKQLGEVVAVTGDGTNDAPALKEADVGLAMGIAGTEVAKEAADIVIMDVNFSSVVKAVLWGRSVLANIRKFLQFQVRHACTCSRMLAHACACLHLLARSFHGFVSDRVRSCPST